MQTPWTWTLDSTINGMFGMEFSFISSTFRLLASPRRAISQGSEILLSKTRFILGLRPSCWRFLSLTRPAFLWGPPTSSGLTFNLFPWWRPSREEDAGESKSFWKCLFVPFDVLGAPYEGMSLFLRRLINEKSPGGRIEGLNQQIPHLVAVDAWATYLFIQPVYRGWLVSINALTGREPPLRGFHTREGRTVSSSFQILWCKVLWPLGPNLQLISQLCHSTLWE